MDLPRTAWWSEPEQALNARLASGPSGLSSADAAARLKAVGPNAVEARRRATWLSAFATQLRSPLVLLLVSAAIVSAFLRAWTDAGVVVTIVVGSALLGTFHEWRASAAVEALQARVSLRAKVVRDGVTVALPARELVPGDVIELAAGSLVPADARVLTARDFFVGEAMLTGESYPVEKEPGVVPEAAGLAQRTNAVFFGTAVRSGTAHAVVVETGRRTELGAIAHTLALRPPETEFESGLRRFGLLLTEVMAALTIAVFAVNVLLDRPAIEALLFAIALAVGISPELLPAILSVTLSRGATRMAARGVIVKRLASIENLGAMDVLCTDKTGTLTEGVVQLDAALDPEGRPSPRVLALAGANARLQTGLPNPLDEAILRASDAAGVGLSGLEKLDEIPYDFQRKRLGVVVSEGGRPTLIVKGAFEAVLSVCTAVRLDARPAGEAAVPLDEARRAALRARVEAWSADGLRVLPVATRAVEPRARWTKEDERDLVLEGFLRFLDPPKEGVTEVVRALEGLGVELKIVTGDARGVAEHLARTVDLRVAGVMTGADVALLSHEALAQRAERTTIFAEVDPTQKERIIVALRRRGHVVGYVGDGINDAPALHAADVAISVEGATDVAREAADFVLGRRDLDVLRAGVEAGRTTFRNTLKYVHMTTSANFGNMVSMAVASSWLPFLPLLAKQILLNNFLSDLPQMTVAGDAVDQEQQARPQRWDVRAIRDFMIVFGLVSSVFDLLTFALLRTLGASASEFRTAWFVESLLTELGIAFVVRTMRPFWRSRPSLGLGLSSAAVAALTVALPWLPGAGVFGLVPLHPGWIGLVLGITAVYLLVSEVVKQKVWVQRMHEGVRTPTHR